MRELTVWLLCGIGLYASAFMARKAWRDARGQLDEPSVVQVPAARLFFGIPNAVLGIAFYAAVAATIVPAESNLAVRIALRAAVAFATSVSCVLAYDLLARTKRSCPYCWTAHATNVALLLASARLWMK